MNDIAFVLVVTDGRSIRTIHPNGMGAFAPKIERIARSLIGLPVSIVKRAEPPKAANATLTQGEIARQQGYSGDCCPQCMNFKMRRTGTCLTCDACGHNAGCG